MPRKASILVLLLMWLFAGCHTHRTPLSVIAQAKSLPADGRKHQLAFLRTSAPERIQVKSTPANVVHVQMMPDGAASLSLRTPVQPGSLSIIVTDGAATLRLPVTLLPDNTTTADGIPDWMRLHSAEDRRAFRRWFSEVAERTADTSASKLPSEITDCASFIRYAYREALYLHDDRWYAQFPADAMPALPSVQQWSYPNTPLASSLFRTRPGPFRASDLSDGTFTQFADAKTLYNDNAFLLGRDLRLARPGDMIFYRVLETDSQYHSMIITGEHGEWVVYNTGPDHGHHGEMRRVLLADLLHHPDPQWRPEPSNPNWLGVYRWKILRED